MSGVDFKKLVKQARKAAKGGEFLEAARLFEEGGESGEAVQAYLSARAPERAAQLLAKSQKFADAARLYEGLKKYQPAGELYEQARDPRSAAAAYSRAGRPYRHARQLSVGGDWPGAVGAFQKMGLSRRAAEAAEQAGDWVRAAQLYAKAYDEELARHTGDPGAAKAYALLGLAKKSGMLFARGGKVDEAVKVLERAKLYDEIANVFRQAGDYPRAADYLARSGRFLEAAQVLEESGDLNGAERMRGEVCLQKGQVLEAINHFEKAGDLPRAADLYRSKGDFPNAGRLFEAAGDHARAGEVYLQVKYFDKAAAAFEKAGKFREAAKYFTEAGNASKATEMLEKAGAKYEVGLSYFERGLFDQAIRALQAIATGEPDYEKGKKLLGDIFREKGMISLAIKNYQLAVGSSEIGPENAETYYQIALCQEKDNQPEQALAIYEKILVADYHFRDVGQRVQQVRRVMAQKPKTPSGGLAAGIAAGISPGSPREGRFDETVYGAAEPPPREDAVRRYEILNELGRGGMGIVYKARDTMLDRVVALKVLPPALRSHPQALQNFLREAKSAAAMNHPNIVTVYDVGEEAGDFYITMEYVEGKTIKEILIQDKLIPHKAALVIAGQICKALSYAHERKIVHRDIKPSNIMWTDKREVKLMDFGLAKVLKDVTNQTTRVAGTPFYMAPEQVRGEGVDHRADLYALGVTIFEILSGDLPFPEGDISYHHIHTPPPSLLEKVKNLPKAFDDIVQTLMQKKKEDRYQSADEVFEALKRVAGGE